MQEDIQTDENAFIGERRLMTIMFTDVVSSSALMGSNEERTVKLIQRDLRIITRLAEQFGGRILKQMGDGCLGVFESGVKAVECAREIQHYLAEQAQGLPPGEVLLHRIGLHLGDVYVTEDDVLGDGVNVAARLQSEAEPGGICLSQTLYEVVKGRLALQMVYQGPKQLKNISDKVHLYQLVIHEAAESSSAQDHPGEIGGASDSATRLVSGVKASVGNRAWLKRSGVIMGVLLVSLLSALAGWYGWQRLRPVAVAGLWLSDPLTNPFDDNIRYRLLLRLQQQGDTVTGTLVEFGKKPRYRVNRVILEGKIAGDGVSFKTRGESLAGGGGTVSYNDLYQGTVQSDIIRFVWSSDRPWGFPEQSFTVRRMDTPLLDLPEQ